MAQLKWFQTSNRETDKGEGEGKRGKESERKGRTTKERAVCQNRAEGGGREGF